jgi:iron(III) transport system permease protein
LILPLAALFVSGFQDASTGAFSLGGFVKFFQRKYYYQALFNSLAISAIVTAATLLAGIPLSCIMTFFQIRWKRLVQVLIIISMLSPSFIGAYSWVMLLGRNGVVTNLFADVFSVRIPSIYGFGGMTLVFTLKLVPFVYLYVSGALKKIDTSLLEASASLGCGPLRNLVALILPLILPTVLAATLMVFMNSLADFGTPMLIGEGFRVMPVLVYKEFMSEVGGNANFAASIAIIIICVTTGLYLLQKFIVNKMSFHMNAINTIKPRKLTGLKTYLAHLYVYGLVFLAVIPQITVIYTSFLKTNGSVFIKGFSMDSYRSVLSSMGQAITNTYCYGLFAIAAIVLTGMLMSYVSVYKRNALTSILDIVAMFPYIISGSVLGIMLLMAFNKPPLIMSGSSFIIVTAFVIRRLPHTLRSSVAILYQLDPGVEEAAISLGDSPGKAFFKITAVMMLPGVISGAILSWVSVINELSASVVLYTSSTRTMSVAIYNEVFRASYGTAAAISTILTLTTVVSVLIFFKISGNREISL